MFNTRAYRHKTLFPKNVQHQQDAPQPVPLGRPTCLRPMRNDDYTRPRVNQHIEHTPATPAPRLRFPVAPSCRRLSAYGAQREYGHGVGVGATRRVHPPVL